MSAAYIDADYIDAFIGADTRTAIFTTPTAAYSAAQLTTVIQSASADVKMAAKNAGYTLGDTTTDDIVKKATLVQFLRTVNTRKGVSVGEDFIKLWGDYLGGIYRGEIPLDGTPDTSSAVGGAKFSENATSSDTTYTPKLGIGQTGGY